MGSNKNYNIIFFAALLGSSVINELVYVTGPEKTGLIYM